MATVSVAARTVARLALLLLVSLIAAVRATPLLAPSPSYHPIVLWHGLGDSAYSEPMQELAQQLRDAYPGIYVRLVSLADSMAADQRAGFFGNVNEQVERVCSDLAQDAELHDGFDAIGFSQGGQFLRAYVQRCNTPAVRNLITFGSQHMGISDLPACKPNELLCRLAEGALRNGVYSNFSQSNIVTAQYYRDPVSLQHYQQYLASNHFIADINNEITQNEAYKTNLKTLDNLVLLMFDHDTTVEPKQSSWFASYPVATEDNDGTKEDLEVEPLRQSKLYKDDLLGLRALDKRGALVMDACRGVHMQIDEACSQKVFGRFAGVAPPSKIVPRALRHAWARSVYMLTGVRIGQLPGGVQVLLFAAIASIVILLLRVAAHQVATRRSKGAIRLN